MSKRRWTAPRITRDSVLFIGGLAGVYHEVVIRSPNLPERPFILGFFAVMLGLPAFLGWDERKASQRSPAPPAPPSPPADSELSQEEA